LSSFGEDDYERSTPRIQEGSDGLQGTMLDPGIVLTCVEVLAQRGLELQALALSGVDEFRQGGSGRGSRGRGGHLVSIF
jgi:hypothetical protein